MKLHQQRHQSTKERGGLVVREALPHLQDPTSTWILISSEARHHQDEVKRCKTVKHLSHSAHTSETYYEYMNTDDVTEAHANVSAL